MTTTATDSAAEGPLAPPSAPELTSRLPGLYTAPATLGPLAVARRRARSGDTIAITSRPAAEIPAVALRVRNGDSEPLDAWPTSAQWQPGDHVVVAVPADAERRAAFVSWCSELQPPADASLAPCSADEGALHRLWCVAAARIVLPPHVGIEARHDLLGIRLAQLALAMGADALSGPIESDRVLPLAGVPRPTESTRAGLTALVEHAGLTPSFPE